MTPSLATQTSWESALATQYAERLTWALTILRPLYAAAPGSHDDKCDCVFGSVHAGISADLMDAAGRVLDAEYAIVEHAEEMAARWVG